MTIKITQGEKGGRKVKLDIRLSDYSGHADIIDMLEILRDKKWSQTTVVHNGLVLLLDEFRNHEVTPLSPTAEYVSSEMLELVKKAQDAMSRTNEILQLVLSGAISQGNVGQYQQEIKRIQGDLDFHVIEGAGNYAGEVSINDNEEDWEWE